MNVSTVRGLWINVRLGMNARKLWHYVLTSHECCNVRRRVLAADRLQSLL